LIAYYDEWGWVDFLVEIAKTKMFDIDGAGLDSIECAKRAKAFTVLTYASSERDKGVAIKNAYDLKS
jgi:hypothetical protein